MNLYHIGYYIQMYWCPVHGRGPTQATLHMHARNRLLGIVPDFCAIVWHDLQARCELSPSDFWSLERLYVDRLVSALWAIISVGRMCWIPVQPTLHLWSLLLYSHAAFQTSPDVL